MRAFFFKISRATAGGTMLLPTPVLLEMLSHFLAVVLVIHLSRDNGDLLSCILDNLYQECPFAKTMNNPVEFIDSSILPIMRGLNLKHVFDIPIEVLSKGSNNNRNYQQRRTI